MAAGVKWESAEQLLRGKSVEAANGCWLWIGSLDKDGYAKIDTQRWGKHHKVSYAHQLAFIVYRSDYDRSLCVCHTCDTPRCVNPDHLFVGTNQDNASDMVAKGRQTQGEKNPGSKLNEQEVKLIKHLLRGGARQVDIAKQFGVSTTAIGKINRSEYWNYIK